MPSRTHRPAPCPRDRGIVLPIALIMLAIISFAGLIAARNSATFEQFSGNMRGNQVSRVSAEEALRYCERVAIDRTDNSGANFAADVGKIVTTPINGDTITLIQTGNWNTIANWRPGAANLISVVPAYDSSVQTEAKRGTAQQATCIVQSMNQDRYLVTARGLSNDATVSATTGALTSGSEVWLQSILSPTVPILDPNGGIKQ